MRWVNLMARSFLSRLTDSFALPAAENPTVAMIEAAYRRHDLDIRHISREVAPDDLGDTLRAPEQPAHALQPEEEGSANAFD